MGEFVIYPLMDAFGGGFDGLGLDKQHSQGGALWIPQPNECGSATSLYRFVGHKVRALPATRIDPSGRIMTASFFGNTQTKMRIL